MGDQPGRQPIGIVLSVLGVVVLDFCADASEGPIRAYLLDVADTEEQDMALNIHAASAGIVLLRNMSAGFHRRMCSRKLGCFFFIKTVDMQVLEALLVMHSEVWTGQTPSSEQRSSLRSKSCSSLLQFSSLSL